LTSALTGDEYIDLANTYLFVEAHKVADDDTALDAGADAGPVSFCCLFDISSLYDISGNI
jgi:hypothetical protein